MLHPWRAMRCATRNQGEVQKTGSRGLTHPTHADRPVSPALPTGTRDDVRRQSPTAGRSGDAVDLSEVSPRFASLLVGTSLVRTEKGDFDWVLHFAGDVTLRAECPWRILHDGRIALTDSDHAQQFGRPAPIDGPAESDRLLCGRSITRLTVHDETGDLTVAFGDQTKLEILNLSCGYEGWQLSDGAGGVVGMGGGGLATYGSRADGSLFDRCGAPRSLS